MKFNMFFKTLSTILITTIIYSCSSNNNYIPSIEPTIKSSKFEIVRAYEGQIFIIYNDSESGNKSGIVTSLPCSKTNVYLDRVLGIDRSGEAVL